jgi:hypothetical protein
MLDKATYSGRGSALEHRERHGGWVFAATDPTGARRKRWVWYALHWTPSQIMLDPDNKGWNGQLL